MRKPHLREIRALDRVPRTFFSFFLFCFFFVFFFCCVRRVVFCLFALDLLTYYFLATYFLLSSDFVGQC